MQRKCFINGTIISNAVRQNTDILVDNGIIAALGDHKAFGLTKDDEIIDCSGRIILPGIIDAHCHIQLDTGIFQTHDGWWNGSQEAARGGITTVIDFVGPQPGEDLRHALDFRLEQAKDSIVDYTFHMTVLDDTEQSLDAIDKCPGWGISSLKIYTTYRPNYYLDDQAIVRILERAAKAGLTVLVHCENDAIVTHETARIASKDLWRDYPRLRPAIAEVEAAERIIRLADYTGARVVIAHNSSEQTADVVSQARAEGISVFNETCPQYLFLCDEDNFSNDEPWRFILQPPLRDELALDGLAQAILADDIDMVITDHCAYTRDEKTANPLATPGGLPGFETLLPMLASLPDITWEQVSCLLCRNPAQIYGLWPHKGAIAPGFDADIIVIRDETYTIDETQLHSFAGYSPFNGHEARGIIERVFRRGEEIIHHGKTLAAQGSGRFFKVGD
ncbi:MAG: amidohydrolase family protein [Proteobacteria bacterium]|nr:amidohydrolase family protein [Pseudomonadota bacterium]